MRQGANEQRSAYRYGAANCVAILGWWIGEAFQTTSATVKDVSLGGVAVELEMLPPDRAAVWICLPGHPPNEWAEVTVVEQRKLRSRRHLLRLKFHGPSALEFFKAATGGFGKALDRPPPPFSEEFDSRIWR